MMFAGWRFFSFCDLTRQDHLLVAQKSRRPVPRVEVVQAFRHRQRCHLLLHSLNAARSFVVGFMPLAA